MSDTYVFPGGMCDAADGSLERAAIRELFEEAGVLLARPAGAPARRGSASGAPPLAAADLARWRARLLEGSVTFAEVCDALAVEPDAASLHSWARWITPSLEPRRFDATFFLAGAPDGQEPSFDDRETVDAAWMTPAELLAAAAAERIKVPPPQLWTFLELAALAPAGARGAIAAAAARGPAARAPILPRMTQQDGRLAVLLPWDPGYDAATGGEGLAAPADHPMAAGPTRLILEGTTWRASLP